MRRNRRTRRATRPFGRLGRLWPLWSVLGGGFVASLTVLVMRFVG